MKKLWVVVFFLAGLTAMRSQIDAWIYLHDKPDAEYYLNHPSEMLSKRALDRRMRYGIDLDIRDVPIDSAYYNMIYHSPGIHIKGHSKWLNAIHVQGDSTDIASLLTYTFIDSIVLADKRVLSKVDTNPVVYSSRKLAARRIDYGNDTMAYVMHHAFAVHEAGLTGKNILIAVIDAGFPTADTSRVLRHIYRRDGVIDTYNFPDRTNHVYTRHPHGTMVWSLIGGLEEGELIGTAYEADFCLYISEDVSMEMPVEETYWVMAAERADSVGVDLINTSLGYIDFDNPKYNHTWEELDGKTAFASRGAQIATEKGIHVVVSAGNAGNIPWKKISVPADAKDVIAVGAADAFKNRASFSSTGNTSDGRIKPDVMSWGVRVKTFYAGHYWAVSGTSAAAPIITGFVADMVQHYPFLPPVEMKNYLLQSSDRFHSPDSLYGYGFPDFTLMMKNLDSLKDNQVGALRVYPNPFSNEIKVSGMIAPMEYSLFDINGKMIHNGQLYPVTSWTGLKRGIYLLLIYNERKKRIIKLIKQPE